MVKKLTLEKISVDDLLDVDDDEYVYIRYVLYDEHMIIIPPSMSVGIIDEVLYVFNDDGELEYKVRLCNITVLFKYRIE